MTTLPTTDEEAEKALRKLYAHTKEAVGIGDSVCGIYQCRRASGASILDAYEAALLALAEAAEQRRSAQ